MKTMKLWRIAFMMLAAFYLASCKPSARHSITVEIVNNTESTCITGEAYTIEQRVNDVWTILPIKPRKDGAVYAFNDIGYELAPHSTRLFTIHVDSDKYDFERGQEYRIVKEFFKKGKKVPQNVYCYFTIE